MWLSWWIERVFNTFDKESLKDNIFSFVFIAVFKSLDKSNVLVHTFLDKSVHEEFLSFPFTKSAVNPISASLYHPIWVIIMKIIYL